MQRRDPLQTPQKEHLLVNRRSKSGSDHSKKPQKISKKCLDSVFTAVSEEMLLESPKDSIDISSISEISDDNQLGDPGESFIASPSSTTMSLSNLTSFSSTITAEKDDAGDISNHQRQSAALDFPITSSMEAEMIAKRLKEGRLQILNSTDLDIDSKKLLDLMINFVIQEFHSLPEEKDRFTELASKKARIAFVGFALWILTVLAILFFNSGSMSSSYQPPPT